MPAFLKNLFKSKRPNPSSSKPIAIENLDPSRAKDRETLFQLIIDPDSSAHQINAALTKTGSLDIIVRWHEAAPPAIQPHIADWIARQTSNPKRLAQARGRLDNPQLQQVFDQLTGGLVEPASSTTEGTLSRSGLQLEQLAIQAKTSQARQSAVDQVTDEAALQRIVKAAKGRDKSVYQIARQKLQALREEAAKTAAARAEIEKVLEQCEAHARTESTKLYQPRFESLLKSWNSLQGEITPEEKQRFEAARTLCQARCDELRSRAQQEAEAKARIEERAATLALLQDTIAQLKQATPEQIPSVSSLDAMQKTQENRWLEATREAEVDPQAQQSFEQLMQSLRQYLQAHQRLEAHQGELQAALDATPEDSHSSILRTLVKTIAWPAGYSPPTVLSAAEARLKSAPRDVPPARRSQKSDDTSQLQNLLDKLQEVLEQKELKPSRKLLKEVQQAAESLSERARRPFQARVALLTRQMQDLQDWHGFATRPKQEALCEQMEHLAEQHLEPELKAAKIHELQEQWRELGGSSDQLLWQRFKQAADTAFAPCQAYFAARNELKAANLHKREQICDELSMFISGVDWTGCDWRGVEKIHRQARQEWRDAKPIDFRRNRNVQRRFDDLLKDIDARLDEERARNEAAKADIVTRAQALADHEPLAEAMATAKEMQKEWEGIGITRQKRDRVLWQSFRTACDAVFSRRDDKRAEEQAQTSEQLSAAEFALSQVEQLLEEGENLHAIEQGLKDFRELSLPSRQREYLNKRLEELRNRFQDISQRSQRQQQKQLWLEQLRQANTGTADTTTVKEICIRAEILAGLESPPEDQDQRMTLQVERLAAGMGQGLNFPDAKAEMNHLLSLWKNNPPASSEPALLARMEAAIETLQN